MKILLIVTGDTGLQYHRQLTPHMVMARECGDEVRVLPSFDAVSDLELQYFDIVHFIRHISLQGKTKEIVDRCHANDCKVVFDIDDNYNLNSDHGMFVEKALVNKCIQFKKEKGIQLNEHEAKQIPFGQYVSNVKEAIQYADLVTTTTDFLRTFIGKGVVIPNCIDTTEAQWQTKAKPSDKIRFGWIGGLWHEKDLQLMESSISYVYSDKSLKDYQFVLGGFNVEPQIKEKIIEFQRNNPAYMYGNNPCYRARVNEIENRTQYLRYESIITDGYRMLSTGYRIHLNNYIQQNENTNESYKRVWGKSINQYATIYDDIDISLVPLRNSQFNSCKSELKLVEAGTKKKAVIASNCLPYSSFPDDTIIKIDNDKKGWYKAMKRILNNPNMVVDYSNKLHEFVVEHYNIVKWSKFRHDLYMSI